MSNSNKPRPEVKRAVLRPPSEKNGSNGFCGNGGMADVMHRLRQIHVARGGRIRASWRAVLTVSPLQHLDQSASSGRAHHGRGGEFQRSSCKGYSWAIVRTRGMAAGDGRGGKGMSCVVKQGALPDSSARHACHRSGSVRLTDTDEEGDNHYSSKADVVSSSPSATSPWRWEHLEVDTVGWLPGDLLSLWIRLDDTPPPSPPRLATDGGWHGRGATPAVSGGPGRGDESRRDCPPSHRPLVRAFDLTVIDDAREEEIVRRACCFPRHSPRLASIEYSTLPGERVDRVARVGEVATECFPDFPLVAPYSGVAAVRLDFAAVSPMNIAAAGGSWA